MIRSDGFYAYSSSSYADSIQSNGYSFDESSSQDSSFSRPSPKSIYMHRKEYSESINKQLGKSQYRVEHLFTCELDGEVKGVEDCVERLKVLEAMGHVWGQDMMLEVRDGYLLLNDIETKEELDSLPLSSVLGVKAVLDSCAYNSLLTISVQGLHTHHDTHVFLFQSDSLRADFIKRDLDRTLQNRSEKQKDRNVNRRREEDFMMQESRSPDPRPLSSEWTPPEPRPEEWSSPDYDESPILSPPATRWEPPVEPPPVENMPKRPAPRPEPTPSPPPYTERERNVEILNHLINDIEEFVDTVTAVVPRGDKKKKKSKKKKKTKAVEGLPSEEEFIICLQKIKMAFNLLGLLNGQINNPSAPDLVHCLFSILELVVGEYDESLPPSVVAPLLEPVCVRFLSEEATSEEDRLWQSLGDAWNIPSTKWPEDDDQIPTFTPVFNDGWTPPDLPHTYSHTQKKSMSRQESQRSAGAQSSPSWQPPQTSEEKELPLSYMTVLFEFRGRNDREMSVLKGEVVEILDMSKRWWKVRNHRGEEGYIPNNVLKSMEGEENEEPQMNPTLTRKSRPEEVKAWLEHKEFSKITVRCLGGLSGAMLLGMTREELKIVCPEEGGRVYYQLQNVKSALALAKEVSPLI